jgi:hypothetical protein
MLNIGKIRPVRVILGPDGTASRSLGTFRRRATCHEQGSRRVADAEAVDDEWVQVRLRFPAVPAARTPLSFGGNVEVVSPLEVRADLASVAANVVARYDPGPAGRVV